jgi:hygromycin-B 7''-O-kinase
VSNAYGRLGSMASREYSKRLGTITDRQLQAALDRFDLGQLVAAEPVKGGLFGQNIFVTSTGGEFVLRGAPHHQWQLPTEQFFARMLAERTRVPAPWPFFIDPRNDIFGWSFAIMPKMRGLPLSDFRAKRSLTQDDRRAITLALARGLAAMHELTWPIVGRFVPEIGTVEPFVLAQEIKFPLHTPKRPPAGARAPTDSERVVALIRALVERARKYNAHTTEKDAKWTEILIADSREALEVPFQPCIVMQDYHEDNVVVEHVYDEWRVSGVFDLGGAYFGDGEADICRLLATYLGEEVFLAKQFLSQYLKESPPRPGFEKRFPTYMLLDRLIIWEYVQRTMPETAARMGSLREWAGRCTTALPGLIP